MPSQASWVEHWLASYCPPDGHQFVPWGPVSRVCGRCGKVELLDDRGCLICGLAGDVAVTLARTDAPGDMQGRLCSVCAHEFGARRVIQGWRISPGAPLLLSG